MNARSASRGMRLALLLGGGLLLTLAHGRLAVPVAAWLAPVLLIRFMRTTPVRWGLPAFVIVHTISWELAYLGTLPMPFLASVGLFSGLSLVIGAVFVLDRWVSNSSGAFVTTLIVPCGWVAFEYVNGAFSPSGSWGSIAYTFSDQLVLLQVVSITGWIGITFLLGWTAATANWAWERSLRDTSTLRGLAVTGLALLAVLAYGSVRLARPPAGKETLRVASVVAPSTFEGEHFEDLWAYTRGVEIPAEGVLRAREQIAESRRQHFELVEREIAGGARMVVWAEANAALTAAEEPRWIEQAREIGSRTDTYIGMGLSVFRPQQGLPTENKLVLIGPGGERVWEFLKATRVPGSHHAVGDGMLPLLDADFGRASAAICFDMDFPRLLQQAGANDVDLLLAPSNDWTEVRWVHARMAVMRAVEQGFNLVRPTKDGISVVADYRGRILAMHDTDSATDKVMVANVPTTGVTTLYARVGDAFAWLCCGGLLLLPFVARRHQSEQT